MPTNRLIALARLSATLSVFACIAGFMFYYAVSILSFVVALYLFNNTPKEAHARRGATLIIIASAIEVLFIIGLYGYSMDAINTLNTASIATMTDPEILITATPMLITVTIGFISWVVRIVGTVFSYLDFHRLANANQD